MEIFEAELRIGSRIRDALAGWIIFIPFVLLIIRLFWQFFARGLPFQTLPFCTSHCVDLSWMVRHSSHLSVNAGHHPSSKEQEIGVGCEGFLGSRWGFPQSARETLTYLVAQSVPLFFAFLTYSLNWVACSDFIRSAGFYGVIRGLAMYAAISYAILVALAVVFAVDLNLPGRSIFFLRSQDLVWLTSGPGDQLVTVR